MGKFKCKCGHILSTVSNTNHYEGYLLSNFDLNDMVDEKGNTQIMDIGRDVLECDQCGRLYFEEPRDSNKWVSYLPENGEYNKLLEEKIANANQRKL
jgi:hypothetical protein